METWKEKWKGGKCFDVKEPERGKKK